MGWFDFRQGQGFFPLSKTSGPYLGLIRFLVGAEGSFPKGKADCSELVMALCLLKHRDNFTFISNT